MFQQRNLTSLPEGCFCQNTDSKQTAQAAFRSPFFLNISSVIKNLWFGLAFLNQDRLFSEIESWAIVLLSFSL